MKHVPEPDFLFEVAFSFAAEHRAKVEQIATELARRLQGKDKVLYDLWLPDGAGRVDLDRYLQSRYLRSRLLVFVLSREYSEKNWCGLEWEVFRSLKLEESADRLMLLRVSDGPFRDVLPVANPLDIRHMEASEVVSKILGRHGALLPRATPAELDKTVDGLRETVQDRIQYLCGTIKVLSMSNPIPVDELYTDVNILAARPSHQYKTSEQLIRERGADPSAFLGDLGPAIERVPGIRAFDKSKHLMIFGGPGAGKTTFLKRLAIHCLKGEFRFKLVPAFVPLKLFAESEGTPSLFEFVQAQWKHSENARKALDSGRGLILLDGLDEVRDSDFERVRKSIHLFTAAFHGCTFAITCRTASRENRLGLETFSEVEMADFDRNQIKHFASNWFRAHSQPVERRDLFLAKLDDNERLRELATKPLLLTLLCLVFQEGFGFETRAELYDKGLNVLLDIWDGKRSIERDRPRGLTTSVLTELLEEVAYRHFVRSEYYFRSADLARQIQEYFGDRPQLVKDGCDVDPQRLLDSAEAHLGLLVQRANGLYSFSHLTFQEYLTARRVLKRRELLDEIGPLVGEARFREVWFTLVAMADSGSMILELKRRIDGLVADDSNVQHLLAWSARKAGAQRSGYKAIALRAYYVARTLDGVGVRARALELARALDLAIHRALVRAGTLDLGLDRALDLGRAGALDLVLDLVLNLAGNAELAGAFDRAIELSQADYPALAEELHGLRLRMPKDQEAWRSEEGRAWRAALAQVTLKHRDIGHTWEFSAAQAQMLEKYFVANQLLFDCMKSASGLTQKVREYVENTMILSIEEIRKVSRP